MAGNPLEHRFAPVDALMRQAVAGAVFPGAVVLAARGEAVLFHEAYGVADLVTGRRVTRETVFDLASLTKPLATTLSVMRLEADGRISRDATLAQLLPAFVGGPAAGSRWRPCCGTPRACRPGSRFTKPCATCRRPNAGPNSGSGFAAPPSTTRPASWTVYSDLGFMILAWIVEELAGLPLDRFVAERIYRPLDIAPLYFNDLSRPAPAAGYAATERCPWRGALTGQVHDDNCWTLGGVCGHAGLFAPPRRCTACCRVCWALTGARRTIRSCRPAWCALTWKEAKPGAGRSVSTYPRQTRRPAAGCFRPPRWGISVLPAPASGWTFAAGSSWCCSPTGSTPPAPTRPSGTSGRFFTTWLWEQSADWRIDGSVPW